MMYHVPDTTATDSDYNARMLAQRQHNAPKAFDRAAHERNTAELLALLREIRAECAKLAKLAVPPVHTRREEYAARRGVRLALAALGALEPTDADMLAAQGVDVDALTR